jgi:hypothetical protein
MNDSGWVESREGELDPDLTEDWCDVSDDYLMKPEESHWITGLMCGVLLIVILFPIIYFLFR